MNTNKYSILDVVETALGKEYKMFENVNQIINHLNVIEDQHERIIKLLERLTVAKQCGQMNEECTCRKKTKTEDNEFNLFNTGWGKCKIQKRQTRLHIPAEYQRQMTWDKECERFKTYFKPNHLADGKNLLVITDENNKKFEKEHGSYFERKPKTYTAFNHQNQNQIDIEIFINNVIDDKSVKQLERGEEIEIKADTKEDVIMLRWS